MRLPLPPPPVLPRDELLRSAAERLAAAAGERPTWIADPADPGWLLLEEAAWSAEQSLLSAAPTLPQRAAALAIALGARPRAAVPAMGVVGLVVASPGVVADEAARERLHVVDPHAEERAGVVYVLVEPCPVVVGHIEVEGHAHALRVEAHAGVVRIAVGPTTRGSDIEITTPTGSPVPHQRRAFVGNIGRIWILTIPLDGRPGPAELRVRVPAAADVVLNPAVVVNAPRSEVHQDVPVPSVGLGRWDLLAAPNLRWGAGRVEALVGGPGLAEAVGRLEGGAVDFSAWLHEDAVGVSTSVVGDSVFFRREAVDAARGRSRPHPGRGDVRLAWVRTTCGSAGNAPAGALRFALQAPDLPVRVLDVVAPWPIDGGRDAERAEALLSRLADREDPEAHGFGALPSTLEDRLRTRLARAGLDWLVRVWDRQARELMRLVPWGSLPLVSPGTGGPASVAEVHPADLLIAAGPREAVLWTQAEVQLARSVMREWFADVRSSQEHFTTWEHIPLRDLCAVVPPTSDLPLPTHGLGDLDDDDLLVDAWGERRRPLPGVVLLDGVIVAREDR